MAARTADLPIHFRTGLRAVGIVGGRPVWPILGGEESDDAAAQAAARAAADKAAADKAAADAAAANANKGYPENTPLEQMTDAQRAAYWKHYARQHEERNKPFAGLTAEQLAELRAKAEKHDAMELELGTTAEKAAAKAAQEAKTAARNELEPEVISARLDAAAARAGVSEEDLAKAVEFVDTKKFLTADGKVDADKVKAFVSTIAPAKGNGQQQQRKGPTVTGHGSGGESGSGLSGLNGSELYDRLHPKKTA